MARFGQWNMENEAQPLPTQESNILSIITHPTYYNNGLFHDVAVLVLEKPVLYSANVLPICLPEQGMVFTAGTRCYGTGWGSSSSFGKFLSKLLIEFLVLLLVLALVYICFRTGRCIPSGTSQSQRSHCRSRRVPNAFTRHEIGPTLPVAWIIHLRGK